ncbi:MAG: SDR family oxidoreductase [Candidatus Margulisbacteria bacterium]|jgi:nucleoside-diphosphate-sugar epimerase|nr:SDR family oxidoreductase [Candidatus Margulisiibacteriota bacterium]
MKVFITGGTGFIGSAVIKELVSNGHEVIGLARSEQSRKKLTELSAATIDGSIECPDILRHGARCADAVIHCAFVHNFAEFADACNTDKQAIEALGEALIDTNKPLVVTSGVPNGAPGHVVAEDDVSDTFTPRVSEAVALPFTKRGVDVRIVRPARFVYSGSLTNGFIAALIDIAAQKGESVYVGGGGNHIHAVHVLDLAKLYLLALEKGKSGAKYQGVGDNAIAFRVIAEAIGRRLNVPVKPITPEQAVAYFGFFGAIAGADNPASSEITRAALGWKPAEPSLLAELASGLD